MSNIQNKPKKTVSQLIEEMAERGITFNYINTESAEVYLSEINNYLRTASYRKNYQKYQRGRKQGQYINLDFAYLTELSTIDMHYRFLIQKMCSDIEHSICVKLISDIEKDSTTDGYDLVRNYLHNNPRELQKIEGMVVSPHTGNLLRKYFTLSSHGNRHRIQIQNYDDCPVWVLLELLSFGSLIFFYLDYYPSRNIGHLPRNILNLVRSLRNAAAHNNCILFDLNSRTTTPPREIINFVRGISSISQAQRRSRLTSRAVLEFVALIYIYDRVVDGKVRQHRINELKDLFFVRMVEKKGYFESNDLIKQTHKFVSKIVKEILL
ncbi:MAG: Abi family protein [Streptococcus salivarius]|jgi:abi-like protein|uniref:CAAX protease n=1 Tax=Streptococcus salivarius TaxID=1304 RepID=A0A074IYS8_STRSL|nr:Abi family protein [Streptococcus salivarius]KEO45364.1 CAAX protease [Streptococcus salivarius]KEO46051.1 CAAX protease [Streptococcus salivarius]MBS6731674.1 Abi family protein [Streptococcus salivarius]